MLARAMGTMADACAVRDFDAVPLDIDIDDDSIDPDIELPTLDTQLDARRARVRILSDDALSACRKQPAKKWPLIGGAEPATYSSDVGGIPGQVSLPACLARQPHSRGHIYIYGHTKLDLRASPTFGFICVCRRRPCG